MFDPGARRKNTRSELRSLVLLFGFLATVYFIFVRPEVEDFELTDLECVELNELWLGQYRTDFSFSEKWPSGRFECNSKTSGLVRALKFIDDLEFETPSGAPAVDFYEWARNLKPVFDTDILFRHAGKTAFEERRITISNIALAQNNTLLIAGIIVHELRHLEEGYNSHVPCVHDEAKSCDRKLEQDPRIGGAYNFNIFFYNLVRQHSNASRPRKALARRQMQIIYNERFNETPPGTQAKYALDPPG